MSERVTVFDLLESLADVDEHGGASLSLVAWDQCVEEYRLVEIWLQAVREGLIEAVGRDRQQLL